MTTVLKTDRAWPDADMGVGGARASLASPARRVKRTMIGLTPMPPDTSGNSTTTPLPRARVGFLACFDALAATYLEKGVGTMTATGIASVHGRRVWDSRGRPTVEAVVMLEGGASGCAMAPAGASTGSGEAIDLRDDGAAFGGHSVTRAVGAVNEVIAPALRGMDSAGQATLDGQLTALDGTENKGRLGANATLAVSMAAAHAAAAAGMPLPDYLSCSAAAGMAQTMNTAALVGGR